MTYHQVTQWAGFLGNSIFHSIQTCVILSQTFYFTATLVGLSWRNVNLNTKNDWLFSELGFEVFRTDCFWFDCDMV